MTVAGRLRNFAGKMCDSIGHVTRIRRGFALGQAERTFDMNLSRGIWRLNPVGAIAVANLLCLGLCRLLLTKLDCDSIGVESKFFVLRFYWRLLAALVNRDVFVSQELLGS
jgi:hypothetical protein